MKSSLTEGVDFYYNAEGLMVLTTSYLLNRGECCGSGCKHCPYNYSNVPQPRRDHLLHQRNQDQSD
ncbi:MAG: hypothetical protein EOO04_11500 [Chitinophagaceae bacterium]|nr:MAG: hypothetical protein EOO04_11500 [Chitinophagaceae bacterium]